jgi:hypothetical protein
VEQATWSGQAKLENAWRVLQFGLQSSRQQIKEQLRRVKLQGQELGICVLGTLESRPFCGHGWGWPTRCRGSTSRFKFVTVGSVADVGFGISPESKWSASDQSSAHHPFS